MILRYPSLAISLPKLRFSIGRIIGRSFTSSMTIDRWSISVDRDSIASVEFRFYRTAARRALANGNENGGDCEPLLAYADYEKGRKIIIRIRNPRPGERCGCGEGGPRAIIRRSRRKDSARGRVRARARARTHTQRGVSRYYFQTVNYPPR